MTLCWTRSERIINRRFLSLSPHNLCMHAHAHTHNIQIIHTIIGSSITYRPLRRTHFNAEECRRLGDDYGSWTGLRIHGLIFGFGFGLMRSSMTTISIDHMDYQERTMRRGGIPAKRAIQKPKSHGVCACAVGQTPKLTKFEKCTSDKKSPPGEGYTLVNVR